MHDEHAGLGHGDQRGGDRFHGARDLAGHPPLTTMARIITPASYHADPADHSLADAIMQRLGLDPNDVMQIEVSEGGNNILDSPIGE